MLSDPVAVVRGAHLDRCQRAPADRPRARICVLTEELSGAPDEGRKKFALALADALARQQHAVSLVATRGSAASLLPGARLAPAPSTFLSRGLAAELRQSRPDVIFYVATASTTVMAFVRSRALKAMCPTAAVVLLGLQARRHGRLARRAIRYLRPDLVCVQAPDSQRYLEQLGCSVRLLPSGVDAHTFCPVAPERRRELRSRYGLRLDAPTVLHVGHLKAGRGIRRLAELSSGGACQVVLVTSSSTPRDLELARELQLAGVTVRTQYEPYVEQLYQLADCYVFPVESTDNAIEVPLSVLEAFACDLPVVTSRFGGLPRLFGGANCPGLAFVDSTAALVEAATRLARCPQRGTRPLALPYSWEAIASRLLEEALPSSATARIKEEENRA